jgi:hypothetical protein
MSRVTVMTRNALCYLGIHLWTTANTLPYFVRCRFCGTQKPVLEVF